MVIDVEKWMVLRADGARMDEIMVENMVFTSISKTRQRVEVLFGGKYSSTSAPPHSPHPVSCAITVIHYCFNAIRSILGRADRLTTMPHLVQTILHVIVWER